MFRFESSIQNKVRAGYYICLALIIVVSLLNYLNLTRIDRKINFGFIISELFDTTLEMRRFEKNYFLYRDKEDYAENLRFTEKAEYIIGQNKGDIKKLSIKADVYALETDIREYKLLMQRYFKLDKTLHPVDAYDLEGRIRLRGKKLVTATEAVSVAERKYIQSLIKSSGRVLVVSVIFLIIAGLIIGQYLSRMVVRPLKQLEGCMRLIADGKFDTLACDSSETEIVSLSKAFSKMIKELELRQMKVIIQSEKLISLGTMVSGITHQLNNPLSNISTSCQILNEEIDEADIKYKRELLEQIEGQVERAKSMVHSLLEFARKKEFKAKPLPLKDLMDDTVRLLQGDIPTNVGIETDIPEDVWIIADKQRIQQAFLNIIKNGIDAIPEEGEVSISAEENSETKTVEIKIKDTGAGIEQENIAKIFEPFFTTKDEEKGSGLGLFVAREIIEEHGGFIEVESAAGQGTTFSIKLPLKET
ncbi:MAG: HAMP domain-containing histidine kinase [Nitrospirae bacterium]|nr:MAG: HAMP domain-containing histidine kinase [Nitrospirota bacterium]